MIAAIRREWHAWCRQLAQIVGQEREDWRLNFVSIVFFTVVAFVGRYTGIDGRPWMENPWPALGLGLGASLYIMAVNLWMARHPLSEGMTGIGYLLGTSLIMQSALEFANAARGALFYGLIVMYVFSGTFYVWRLRITARRPFAILAWALGLAIAAAHAPQGEHLLVYGLLAFWLPALFVVGRSSANAAAAREREAALVAQNAALALELERHQVGRLEEFLEGIAGRTHDIGGPALALEMALERASASVSAGECSACAGARDALGQAMRQAADLRALVRRAKDEVRSVSLPAFEAVELSEVVRGVAEGLRLRFPDVAIELEQEPASIAVRGGRLALARVLENLGANGAEAARESGEPALSFGWSPAEDAVEIAIEDSGPGFDPDAPVETRGSGVGLLSARRIVWTSNGTLHIERSARLGGARCLVRLAAGALGTKVG